MKGICYLEDLIKGLEEYEKNKVKRVCVGIDETGGIIMAPDRNDVPVMNIDWVQFL